MAAAAAATLGATDNGGRKKRALSSIFSMPNDCPIREKIFAKIPLEDLNAKTGVAKLKEFLKQEYGKGELEDVWNKYEAFENCQRSSGEDMHSFISNFDIKYSAVEKKGIKLPHAVLCFMLIKRAMITNEDIIL